MVHQLYLNYTLFYAFVNITVKKYLFCLFFTIILLKLIIAQRFNSFLYLESKKLTSYNLKSQFTPADFYEDKGREIYRRCRIFSQIIILHFYRKLAASTRISLSRQAVYRKYTVL